MPKRMVDLHIDVMILAKLMISRIETWILFAFSAVLFFFFYRYLSEVKSIAYVAGVAGIILSGAAPFVTRVLHNRESRLGVTFAPGARLLGILRYVFPRKAFERIFAQMIEDYREEYFEELAAGGYGRARWLTFCLYFNLVWTCAFWVATSMVKKLVDLWKLS